MTPEEMEERIEEIAEDVDKRLEKIEAILGDWTRQVTPQNLESLKVEIPGSGQYPVDVALKVASIIEADQRELIDNQAEQIELLEARVKKLEEKPSGSVSSPTDNETFPLPTPSGETHDAGDVPGFGNGFHLKSGNFEALLFISDYDNALRILTNHKANADGGHTYAIEHEAQQRIDIETFGVGISYWPPRKNPDGTPFPLTALDKKGGKSIVLRSHDPDGHRSKYIQMYAGLPGQGVQIGVSKNTANVMESPTIQIEPDGTKSIG